MYRKRGEGRLVSEGETRQGKEQQSGGSKLTKGKTEWRPGEVRSKDSMERKEQSVR